MNVKPDVLYNAWDCVEFMDIVSEPTTLFR